MSRFEKLRRLMRIQMLPHTLLGHPAAQLLVTLGIQDGADAIHWWTLPRRTKLKLKARPRFNPDARLRWLDFIVTPICSVACGLGLYQLADRVFHLGPREAALELGACGYEYVSRRGESPEDEAYRVLQQDKGFQLKWDKETGETWWILPPGRTYGGDKGITLAEGNLIRRTGYALKDEKGRMRIKDD